MKGFVEDLKNGPKSVMIREIFFIVLFIITVIGFAIQAFATDSRKVDEIEQLTDRQLCIKGNLKGNEVVERGPRYMTYQDASGVQVTQTSANILDFVFTQNVGELLLDIYDMNDKCMMQSIAFTNYQSTFRMNLIFIPAGTYWLQITNSKGGTCVSKFEK